LKRPLALSDKQMTLLRRFAATLPAERRHGFIHDVCGYLSGEPSDLAVQCAVDAVLDRVASTTTPHLMCDSKE